MRSVLCLNVRIWPFSDEPPTSRRCLKAGHEADLAPPSTLWVLALVDHCCRRRLTSARLLAAWLMTTAP